MIFIHFYLKLLLSQNLKKKRKMMVSDKLIRYCQRVIEDRTGFLGPLDKVREIVESDEELCENLNEYEDITEDTTGMDTWERELLLDAFAMKYTEQYMPRNEDFFKADGAEEVKRFLRKLEEKAAEDNWQVNRE